MWSQHLRIFKQECKFYDIHNIYEYIHNEVSKGRDEIKEKLTIDLRSIQAIRNLLNNFLKSTFWIYIRIVLIG